VSVQVWVIWMRLPQVSSKTAVVTGPWLVGGWVKRTPRAQRRACSRWTLSTAKEAAGMPRGDEGGFVGFGGGVGVGL
jgi:hypothetical protein